jgi:hypothetical protein
MSIDPLLLLTLSLVASLGLLLVLAVGYDIRCFRKRKKSEKTLYRCDICNVIYTAPNRIPLARCPGCGKQNKPITD